MAIFSLGLYLSAREARDRELGKVLTTELREFVAHFQDEYDEFRRGLYPKLEPDLEEFTDRGSMTLGPASSSGTPARLNSP